MYAAVSQNLLEGILRPRLSFRRILDLDCDGRDIGLMVLFGYLLTAIFTLILEPEIAITGAGHIWGVLAKTVEVLILGWLAWFPPKIFGGTGHWKEALQASAWLSILMSVLAPMLILAISMIPSGEELNRILTSDDPLRANGIPSTALSLLIVCGIWVTWLFSAMIAEIHGFQKTWRVMAVIFSAAALLSMLVAG